MLVLGLGLGLKDKICGLGLVGEKQNFNIVCRLYEKTMNSFNSIPIVLVFRSSQLWLLLIYM